MSILIKNQDMPKEGEKYLLEIRHDGTVYDAIGQRVAAQAVQFESPWHRAEEPPKEEGRYWCAVWFDGHWIFDAAWYTHDISTVIEVPCCEQVGGFYKGNIEVHPDYWMPIDPPKEDA